MGRWLPATLVSSSLDTFPLMTCLPACNFMPALTSSLIWKLTSSIPCLSFNLWVFPKRIKWKCQLSEVTNIRGCLMSSSGLAVSKLMEKWAWMQWNRNRITYFYKQVCQPRGKHQLFSVWCYNRSISNYQELQRTLSWYRSIFNDSFGH